MKKRHLLALFFVMTTSVFSKSDSDKAIFGKDDRTPMLSKSYPWSTIGKINVETNQENGHCTGTLISEDIVLTNAHCVLTKKGFVQNKITFQPNYKKGSSIVSAKAIDVVYGTTDYYNDEGNDWAFIRLDRKLGSFFGYMDIDVDITRKDSVTLAGYSGDFQNAKTAGVHEGCSIKHFHHNFNVYFHDCDMTKGASGSPIFYMNGGRAVIKALNSAQLSTRNRRDQYSSKYGNLAVAPYNFIGALEEFKTRNVEDRKTEVFVCNNSKKKYRVALGVKNYKTKISKGYIKLRPNRCRIVNFREVINGDLYIYGAHQSPKTESFCTNKRFSFHKKDPNCSTKKMKKYSFIKKIKSDKFNFITLE